MIQHYIMSRHLVTCFFSATVLCLIFLSGCTEGTDPKILSARKLSQLSDSPGKAESIKLAREASDKDEEFIISGKVGVRDLNQWWVDGFATFWITEAGQEEANHGGPGHDPDSCPFCKRKWKETVAVIQCIDKNANVIPIDAKTLFDLKEGDFVTVKGKGEIDDSGILNVKTSGVYIHPQQ